MILSITFRQIYEGKASNEKPRKVKRLEIDDSSSPILVPTSESHTSCRLFFPPQSPSGPSHPKVFRAEVILENFLSCFIFLTISFCYRIFPTIYLKISSSLMSQTEFL